MDQQRHFPLFLLHFAVEIFQWGTGKLVLYLSMASTEFFFHSCLHRLVRKPISLCAVITSGYPIRKENNISLRTHSADQVRGSQPSGHHIANIQLLRLVFDESRNNLHSFGSQAMSIINRDKK